MYTKCVTQFIIVVLSIYDSLYLSLSLSIQLHYFRFPKGVTAVRVVVSSNSSNNCAIVSVQNASVSLLA